MTSPRMPAEWEPHAATWLAWPHNARDWPAKLAAIHWVYVEIVRLLQRAEPVRILVHDERWKARVERMLLDGGVDMDRVKLILQPTDRSWVRDSGPTFVLRGKKAEAVCWRFNAWARYRNWRRDVHVAGRIAGCAGTPVHEPTRNGRRVVLEGGAIESDGKGRLLVTEECLLSGTQQRNPGFSREDYEAVFAEHLGAGEVIWLASGIVGDDTHGHIDDLARFVAPGVVATVVESNRRDENYAPLRANLKRLRDRGGLELVELPMPRPLYFRGERLPASYANFYVANGLVLAPTFNDPNDRVALRILEDAFPGREVVGVHSVDLVWGFGTLHCATQQQPASAVKR